MSDELKHYGVKGMKWGVRRYQNPDGSRKPAGKKRERKSLKSRYTDAMDRANSKSAKRTAKRKAAVKAAPKKAAKEYKKAVSKHESRTKKGLSKKIPNAAVGVATALAINSVTAVPAAMAGRAMFGDMGGTAGTLASMAASIDTGVKVYELMNEG